MMIVCIENRIPLFVVGKPGSSKSLSKSMVLDAMKGDQSRSDLFKEMKRVGIYQGMFNQLLRIIDYNFLMMWEQHSQDRPAKIPVFILLFRPTCHHSNAADTPQLQEFLEYSKIVLHFKRNRTRPSLSRQLCLMRLAQLRIQRICH